MKLHALTIALALAAGSVLAQAPSGTAKAPVDPPAATTTTTVTTTTKTRTVHKKKMAKKAKATRHAGASKPGQAGARMNAAHAKARRTGTHTMGAASASPSTDLEAAARQQRMDSAYADWRARR